MALWGLQSVHSQMAAIVKKNPTLNSLFAAQYRLVRTSQSHHCQHQPSPANHPAISSTLVDFIPESHHSISLNCSTSHLKSALRSHRPESQTCQILRGQLWHRPTVLSQLTRTNAIRLYSTVNQPTIDLPITFKDGFFRVHLGDVHCVFHYWSPVDTVVHTFREELLALEDNTALQEQINCKLISVSELRFEFMGDEISSQTNGTEETGDARQAARVVLFSSRRMRITPSMPLGYAFMALDINQILLTATGLCEGDSLSQSHQIVVQFRFDDVSRIMRPKLQKWIELNQKGSFGFKKAIDAGDPLITHELMYLEQQRMAIKSKLDPLEIQFKRLVQRSRVETHRNFKFGGLFLLSTQLGFVCRLTWFEYSWDIMEPVTWMLTNVMMVGAFAYYIVTSQEYVVPMVEKRMILRRFWKLASNEKFDISQYRLLRKELLFTERQIKRLKESSLL